MTAAKIAGRGADSLEVYIRGGKLASTAQSGDDAQAEPKFCLGHGSHENEAGGATAREARRDGDAAAASKLANACEGWCGRALERELRGFTAKQPQLSLQKIFFREDNGSTASTMMSRPDLQLRMASDATERVKEEGDHTTSPRATRGTQLIGGSGSLRLSNRPEGYVAPLDGCRIEEHEDSTEGLAGLCW